MPHDLTSQPKLLLVLPIFLVIMWSFFTGDLDPKTMVVVTLGRGRSSEVNLIEKMILGLKMVSVAGWSLLRGSL